MFHVGIDGPDLYENTIDCLAMYTSTRFKYGCGCLCACILKRTLVLKCLRWLKALLRIKKHLGDLFKI